MNGMIEREKNTLKKKEWTGDKRNRELKAQKDRTEGKWQMNNERKKSHTQRPNMWTASWNIFKLLLMQVRYQILKVLHRVAWYKFTVAYHPNNQHIPHYRSHQPKRRYCQYFCFSICFSKYFILAIIKKYVLNTNYHIQGHVTIFSGYDAQIHRTVILYVTEEKRALGLK